MSYRYETILKAFYVCSLGLLWSLYDLLMLAFLCAVRLFPLGPVRVNQKEIINNVENMLWLYVSMGNVRYTFKSWCDVYHVKSLCVTIPGQSWNDMKRKSTKKGL